MVKDIQTTVLMKTRGMEITIIQVQKEGSKLVQDMQMAGRSMGKTILNGDKAIETGQGGAAREIEGEELLELKEQSAPFKELLYTGKGYEIELKGIEEIDGKAAYAIQITHPNGSVSTDYFDVATSLKVRDMSTSTGPDGSDATVTNDYADYREVNGIKLPHTTVTTGVFPVPMKGEVTEIIINGGVDDAMFELK